MDGVIGILDGVFSILDGFLVLWTMNLIFWRLFQFWGWVFSDWDPGHGWSGVVVGCCGCGPVLRWAVVCGVVVVRAVFVFCEVRRLLTAGRGSLVTVLLLYYT